MRRGLLIALAAVLLLVAAGAAALYRFALPGLSSARPTPPVDRNGSRNLAAAE